MCPKISLKWDNFSSYLFPPTLSTDIAMQRCILGNIFDNHLIKILAKYTNRSFLPFTKGSFLVILYSL